MTAVFKKVDKVLVSLRDVIGDVIWMNVNEFQEFGVVCFVCHVDRD